MEVGQKIKLVRLHRGLTQKQLGDLLNLGDGGANRIAQYEIGYRVPKPSLLKEIAKFGCQRRNIFRERQISLRHPADNYVVRF